MRTLGRGLLNMQVSTPQEYFAPKLSRTVVSDNWVQLLYPGIRPMVYRIGFDIAADARFARHSVAVSSDKLLRRLGIRR